MNELSASKSDRDQPAPGSPRAARIQFGLCLAVTVGVLVYLLWSPASQTSDSGDARVAAGTPIEVSSDGLIRIQPSSPLQQKLEVVSVKPDKLALPVLSVTGSVVASLRSVKGKGRLWQFSSPELLTAYTDWQKALADIGFARSQLDSIRKLSENRVNAQGALARRLKRLVEAGTDTEKDLAAAQTELLQAQVQGRKDTHEAETALRLAARAEAALARQLEQAGLDPELLRTATTELDVVVADVPEAMVSRVRLGQRCEARFLGLGERGFSGTVRAISPVLSKERRSLRVLFSIDDPDDRLRPGMFAEIGLGTDSREALLAPLAAVVHVGRADYVLVQARAGAWRVAEVQVGERVIRGREQVEVLSGLRAGDRILGQGAILLKPIIVEALQRQTQGVGGA